MERKALLGIFPYMDDFLKAMRQLKKDKTQFRVFAPTDRDEIKEAITAPPSPIRPITLAGGIIGGASGMSLAVFTVWQWKVIVSGKPLIPWIPFIVPAYEFTILFGVVIPFIGVLVLSQLPRRGLPDYYDPRFSKDHFGILLPYKPAEKDLHAEFLRKAGAEEIRDVQQ